MMLILNVFDTAVVERSSLLAREVDNYLIELTSLGLIKMLQKVSNEENNNNFQLFCIINYKAILV
jgi:hypothetical protein